MQNCLLFFLLLLGIGAVKAQKKTIAEIKTALEQSPNPPLYVKEVLKKKFVLDTVAVMRTTAFAGIADSLAYKGRIKKVYGPFDNGRVLVQVLAKLPNSFNHLHQIFLDTAIFTFKKADSLSKAFLARIQTGNDRFEDLAAVWSMGGEAATRGDLGWIASGALVPEIERELRKHKKADVFIVWSRTGVHIIRKTDSKQDNGFALLMRIFL